MRTLLLLFIVLLTGCATSGIRYYEPVTRVDKAGNQYQRNELVAAVETDMPGLSQLRIGKLEATFSGQTMQCQEAVYDRKGNYVAPLNQTYLPGMYSSHTIDAKGKAYREIINSTGAAGTGILATLGGVLVTGGAASLLHP